MNPASRAVRVAKATQAPAPKGEGKSGSASPEGPGGAQTSEERRQAGEKDLDDSLGDFDKTLKKEQERVAKERDSRGSGETEGESGDDGSGSGEGAGEGGGSGQPRSGDLQSAGNQSSKDGNSDGDPNAQGEGAKGSGSGAGSQKVRTGSDDDIVAKRLRKAAEEETDPELKERLWKEYNDYKKATG